MSFSKSQLIIIGIACFIVFLIVVIIMFGRPPVSEKAELEFWGVESSSYFSEVIAEYTSDHKGVTVNYTKFDEANYESELVDALAAGSGPDIFMFGSRWLPRHQNKISPASVEKIGVSRFNDLFPQVAAQDFTLNSQVYAAPLYIDTLALYYNRDAFDRLAIPLSPKTWDDFKGLVTIKRASASFGGYAPLISKAADIMDALLMQSGSDLDLKNKNFVRLSSGDQVLNFYLQFPIPKEETITGFSGERITMMIGYHSDQTEIKAKNPFINLGVSALPQFHVDSPVVPARYYGIAVSSKSPSKEAAWDFIDYVTTDMSAAETLVKKGTHPPALRSLIQKYSDDSNIGVFARQALIARSWFASDDRRVAVILNDMIRSATSTKNISAARQAAEEQINNLISR